jgi:hypothetical protein
MLVASSILRKRVWRAKEGYCKLRIINVGVSISLPVQNNIELEYMLYALEHINTIKHL